MKIGVKLTVIMIGLNLAGIGLLGSILVSRSRVEIAGQVNDRAVAIAKDSGKEIRLYLEAYLDMMRTAAQIMTQYEAIKTEERRPVFSAQLKALLIANPELIGVWSMWEPNALDGRDAEYAGSEESGVSGRFIPYWYPDERGNIVYEPLDDFDDDFYQIPKRTGNEIILDPYTYRVNGKDVLLTTLAVPIKKNNQVVGVVGLDMGLDYIQKLITGIDPFGNKTTAVFSAGGVVAGHFDEGRLGKNIRDSEKDMAGPYLDALYTAVNTGQFFNYTIYDSALKTNLHVFAVPFPIGKTGTPWTLALAVSEKAAMAPISRLVSLSILICGIIVVVIAAAAFFFSRSISKPIVHTVEMLKDISNGEGDLTQTIESTSADEIGDLGHYFNQTLDKIKNLVITIKKQADRLSDIGNDLASNMTESAAAVNEIASNINSIKQRVINQSGSVNQTNAAMERITDNIGKLNQHVEEQSAGVSGSSASIEEMLANIQSVTRTLIKNEDNVKALSEASEVGRNSLQEVSADIQEIARESAGLLEINAVMENIASQTNLLSMNAAIEAAHAGEVGKGFAVVADEIRKLAESSSEQSKTISSVLKKIKNSIDKITESTNNVLNKFEAIDHRVRTVAQQEGDIRSAMEEQSAGSKQILDSIAGLNEITQQVKKGSTEMLNGSKEVIRESKNLAEETHEIAGGMNEMAAGADQINVAINRVSELSGQNRDNIAILIREVSRFKVE